MITRRDHSGHTTVLAATPSGPWPRHRHAEAKYAKFAYATAFGFAVPTAPIGLNAAAIDSMLAFSDDGRHWRTREETVRTAVENQTDLAAVWQPWPDVEVITRLRFVGDWQLREHRITTARPLHTAEGAYCVPNTETATTHGTDSAALAVADDRASGIRDLTGGRRPTVLRPDPNSHLLWPRTLLPALRGELAPGEHRLVTAVFADATGDPTGFHTPPTDA